MPGAAPTVVHDLDTNTADIISVTPSGVFANGSSDQPIFSDDGTAVLFFSTADNLHPDDTDRDYSVYVKDLVTGQIILASRDLNGDSIPVRIRSAAISATGRYVAFGTDGSYTEIPRSSGYQIFLFDRQTGRSRVLSQAFDGGRVTNRSWVQPEAFARDGRLVFEGRDPNYDVNDLNGTKADIYLTACGL